MQVTFTFHYGSINTYQLILLIQPHQYLHSTMVLLIRSYTSINWEGLYYLHSTMVLLIRYLHLSLILRLILFTFHYGSINTGKFHTRKKWTYLFTFHYGSINTTLSKGYLKVTCKFTFHYGSINTASPSTISNASIIIYIPLWFY